MQWWKRLIVQFNNFKIMLWSFSRGIEKKSQFYVKWTWRYISRSHSDWDQASKGESCSVVSHISSSFFPPSFLPSAKVETYSTAIPESVLSDRATSCGAAEVFTQLIHICEELFRKSPRNSWMWFFWQSFKPMRMNNHWFVCRWENMWNRPHLQR